MTNRVGTSCADHAELLRDALRGDRIKEVTAFITRAAPAPDREVVARMPEHPFDPTSLAAAFGNFGLPERLD